MWNSCRTIHRSGGWPRTWASVGVMGIRFYCPNGHKLNVKEFQAGRKGICPFCGAKIEIPTESTRPSTRDEPSRGVARSLDGTIGRHPRRFAEQPVDCGSGVDAARRNGAAAGFRRSDAVYVRPDGPGVEARCVARGSLRRDASERGFPAASVAPSAGRPRADAGNGANPVVPRRSVDDARRSPAAMPAAATAAPGGRPIAAPPVAAAATTSAADPLTEAGDVVWYVRPASGGQFGPAGCEIMRTWLGEGRLGGDSLVWREGWREWQEAAAVFPQLRGATSAASAAVFNPNAPIDSRHRRELVASA